MKILHFVENFSPLSETFIYDYIVELENLGMTNHVVTLARSNVDERPFHRVHPVNIRPRWHPDRFWSRIKVRVGLSYEDEQYWSMLHAQIKQIVQSVEPDLIHAHFGPSGVFMEPLATSLQIPFIVSFHGYDAFKLPRLPIWRKRYAKLFQAASAITTVSGFMRDYLVESLAVPREKIQVVHVGKRIGDYVFRLPELPIRKWLSVGRLIPKKGFFDCIEAMASINESEDITLTIVGQGELESELHKFACERGVLEKVKFLGSIPHKDVIRCMQMSDAFILCSKTSDDGDQEGIPTVLMEAQAIGLPCIATRHSGIPELYPDENHWLLASEGNVSEIRKCINTVISCEYSVLANSTKLARKKIEEEFDLASVVKQLSMLYTTAIQRYAE